MKKIFAFTAATLCAALVFTSCGSAKKGTDIAAVEANPGLEVTGAVTTTLEKSIDKTPVAVLNKVYDSGDVHVAVEMSIDGEKLAYEVWASDDRAALKLDYMGIDGTAYFDTDALVVECEDLLGTQAYGIGFKNFAKNLENSIPPDLMGIDVDEMLDSMDEVVAIIEELNEYIVEQEQYQIEFENKLNAAISNIPHTTTEENFSVSDGAVAAIVFDCKVTPEFVIDVAKEYVSASLSNPIYSYVYDADYIAEINEEIEYEVYNMFNDIGVNEIPLTVVINKATGAFIYAEIANDQNEKIYIDLGQNPESSDEWIFGANVDGETSEIVITKKFSGNNGEFSIKADNEEILAFVVSGGRFDFSVEGITVATGNCKFSNNSFELEIENVFEDGGSLKFTVDTDAAPKAPKYKELLTMTMTEFQQLAQTVQINAMRVAGGMGMLG